MHNYGNHDVSKHVNITSNTLASNDGYKMEVRTVRPGLCTQLAPIRVPTRMTETRDQQRPLARAVRVRATSRRTYRRSGRQRRRLLTMVSITEVPGP